MNRNQLTTKIINSFPQVPQTIVRKVVDSFFSQLTDTLAQDGRIELRKFGSFSIRKRKMASGIFKVVYFRPGSLLKNEVIE